MMGEFRPGDRGVSPVIGVALMVVILVLLSVVSASMLFGFESQLRDPVPVVANEESIHVDLQGNDTQHTLEFVHRGGEPLQADSLRVRVGGGTATESFALDSTSGGGLADGKWSSGERLDLDLNESVVCDGGGDAAEVSLVYERQESSHELSAQSVPIERGQFVIDGDSVRTTADFTANVKFLGTGWSSPTYDAPVNVSVRVNGTEVKAWETVRDSNATVGSYGISRQEAGTSVSITAWGKESWYGGWRTTSESENSAYLVVLRDGDAVPNYDTDAGQQDVTAYASPFIENGTISLDDNQAIYLFDFNRQGTDHETAEYQDAVVLVSFFTRETDTLEVHESRGRDVIVCSAETRSASPNNGGN